MSRGQAHPPAGTRIPAGQPDPVEQAIRHFDMIDAGDPEAMVMLFESDAVYLRPGYQPLVGRAEILRFYTALRPIREGRHTLETVIASHGQVAVRGGFSGRLKNGQPIDLRFSDFFVVSATGRFSLRETFFFAPLA